MVFDGSSGVHLKRAKQTMIREIAFNPQVVWWAASYSSTSRVRWIILEGGETLLERLGHYYEMTFKIEKRCMLLGEASTLRAEVQFKLSATLARTGSVPSGTRTNSLGPGVPW